MRKINIIIEKPIQNSFYNITIPFIPNGLSNPCQLDKPISNSSDDGWYFFQFIKILINKMYANSEATDQTLRSVAADLALHRLPISY